MARGLNEGADDDLDTLAKPHVLRPIQRDGNDRDGIVDGPVGKPLLERKQVTLPGAIGGAFGEQGDHAATLQASVNVLEKPDVAVLLLIHRHIAAYRSNDPPLQL